MARVLLVRLDGIGDALVCTPLLAALRAAGHETGIALSDRNAGIFAPETAVATHVLERIPWPQHGSTPASRSRAEAEIAAQRYDVALIASEEPEAYELAAPVPVRVGFTTGWAKPFKSVWIRRRVTTALTRAATVRGGNAHEAEILFGLGRAAGLIQGEPERDPARLRPLITAAELPQRTGTVVQLGTKWGTTGVSAATLTRLTALRAAEGARFIVAPGERAAVHAALPGLVLDTPADLRAWVAAIDGAATVVTPDTGAAHLAGMLGVAVIDVFPDAHFEAQVRRWRPWASSNIVVRASELNKSDVLIGQAVDGL